MFTRSVRSREHPGHGERGGSRQHVDHVFELSGGAGCSLPLFTYI